MNDARTRACALNCRGHLCCADDRQCLPVCSDFTCSCVSSLAAVLGMEAIENILFIPSVVFFFPPKGSERSTCTQTSVMSLSSMEIPASGTDPGDTGPKLILSAPHPGMAVS